MKQSFLFLQGVCSPFFGQLARRLQSDGHAVRKVNFTVGDSLYWTRQNACAYRKGEESLPDFYSELFARQDISDIVVFGDCRPVHRPAIELSSARGIRVHVFEEGYFRPYWVTLERGGVNGYSQLPKDPLWYRDVATRLPKYGNGTSFSSSFWVRAGHDVLYNFWAGLNPILYPGYRSHVPYSPAAEYLSYVRRALRVRRRSRADTESIASLVREAEKFPFYLLPLQLNSDAQIRHHSAFEDVTAVLSRVIRSFAKHAATNAKLVIKSHPLDPGFCDYRHVAERMAAESGVANRIVHLETGHLPTLLSYCAGVITVNSTVGGSALVHNCPTITLGRAIYDLPGLTFQGELDQFWRDAAPPDKKLFNCFRNVVIHSTQINGGFYCRQGIAMAVEHAVPRMTTCRSSLEELKSWGPCERNG